MSTTTCPKCQTVNPSTNKYCSGCGYELPKLEQSSVQAQETTAATQEFVKPKNNTKIYLLVALIVIVIVGAYYGIQQLTNGSWAYEKVLQATANELNKSCPLTVDSETRLDNAIYIPKNTFQYNYTLVNIASGEIDTVKIKEILSPTIEKNVQTNPQMKIFREHKTTINYYYNDKDGNYLFSISVNQEKLQ